MISQETDKKNNKTNIWIFSMILLAVILWIVAGIAAFVMSLVCFGKSGTRSQHLIGFLLAVFFGPFYWIYYAVVKDYCRKSSF